MVKSTKYLIVVGGPTAAGKTSLALDLAEHLGTEILSADSRQFYQEMHIGNARPGAEELARVRHHFIADRSIHQPLSAGAFAREAQLILEQIYQQQDFAILVGGSGLFIRALTEGLNTFPEVSADTRKRVDDLFEQGGLVALQEAVAAADPTYWEEVDQANPARLRRALEVCWSGDQPYSAYRDQPAAELPFTPIFLQPSWPREQLYARIHQRIDIMLAEGLEAEARSLMAHRDQMAAKKWA
ncbi:MAG: tRNA (adenosine(37)-N6)-dimethylallyltransferase MiaA [Bacteroidota bacterium]